ncbi:MAG: malonyl-CoA synthase [Steroidobacteraceae bacterium]
MSADPLDWIESAARDAPDRIFLMTPAGRALSYAQLRDDSARFAAALMRCGVGPGDRLAVQVDKSVDAVLLYVACLRMGAVFVPVNVAYTPHEAGYVWRDCQPKLGVVRPADLASLMPHAIQAGVPLESLGADGAGSLAALLRECGDEPHVPRAGAASSLAAIVYTSGTTGRSKGAMLSRANLASNAAALVQAWHFTERDVLLHVLPLNHVHGLCAAVNTVLAAGSGLLLLANFDAASVLRELPRVTVFMGVPTHYTRLLQQRGLNRETAAGVRLFISGSAPLPAATHHAFLERTGHAILERYGMTETLMITSNPYDGVRKPASVGVVLPQMAVRVVDASSGALELNSGITGALEVSGPSIFAGYWGDPERTRSEFTADGWFKTGDLGCIDRDGYLYILGRAKDLVISGGYNVYPKEVEMELDALEGVMESAVFGVPHPDFGEGVTAVVVPEPGAQLSEVEIISALNRRLARYKVPKRVLIVGELPRNTMGKVQKNILRASHAPLYADRDVTR